MERVDVGLLCNAPTQRIKDGLFLFDHLGLYRSMTVFGGAYGVRFGLFGIDDLRLDGEELYGTAVVWNQGEYEIVEAKLPKYVESFYVITPGSMKAHPADITKALLQRKISKINPSKDKLPQLLIAGGLAEYVIPSLVVRSFEDVSRGVAQWKHCIIKPNIGKRGRGVFCAKLDGEKLIYENADGSGELTEEFWNEYRQGMPKYDAYILQPRLNFHNRAGQAIDFRLLVSKGGNGTWEIVDIYVRNGQNHIVSNVAKGGLLGSGKEYLKAEFGDEDGKLYQTLCDLGVKVPQAYELALKDRAETFFGIDAGIDLDTLNPYVIEVNAFPGTCFHKYHLAEKRVQYYKYLISQE